MKPALKDSYGRTITYLRLSVTDRCDLRCFYCLPQGFKDFSVPDHWLDFAEIEQVVAAFAELGVERVRITGGEPLVRKDLPRLVRNLADIPHISDLSLSTNAVQLARHAQALHEAGVSRLNVSLDSLQADKFKRITGGSLDKVLHGLAEARRAGFHPVKINMVVMKGVNDDEISNMVEFCIDQDFTLRFIETMPMGETGRNASEHYLDLREVRARLEKTFPLLDATMPGGGPARYVQVAGTDLKLGFITPISQHFCDTCNRVRLGVDGTLYLCLGQEHSLALRPHLRQDISHAGLVNLLAEAILRKPLKHDFEKKPQQIIRFMSQTGG